MKASLSKGIPYLEMLSHDKVVPSKDKDSHTSGQYEQGEPILSKEQKETGQKL